MFAQYKRERERETRKEEGRKEGGLKTQKKEEAKLSSMYTQNL